MDTYDDIQAGARACCTVLLTAISMDVQAESGCIIT